MPNLKKDLAIKVVEHLEAEEGVVQEIADRIKANMRRTVAFFNKDTKQWEERDDGRTQLDAIKLILAYAAGLPLQRSVSLELSQSVAPDETVQRLRESPQLLEAFERTVAKAKFHDRHLKKAAAVNADELPPDA